jgi:hypothetical protein
MLNYQRVIQQYDKFGSEIGDLLSIDGHFQRNDKGMKPRISKALADHGISWFYLYYVCRDQKLDCILLVGGRSTTNQTHIGGIFISWMDMY